MKAEPQQFTATVDELSIQGMGIVKSPSEKIFFVAGVWPGDRGVFTVTSTQKTYGFATLTKLIEASSDRVTPPCPHQGINPGQCGACPWMIGNYSSQLANKQKLLLTSLERAQVLSSSTQIHPINPCSTTLGYRNRVQLKTNGADIGFVSSGSKTLAPIDDCPILNEKCRQLLKSLVAQLPRADWRPPPHFLWSYFEFDDSFADDDLIINHRIPFRQANEEQNQFMKAQCHSWAKNLDINFPLVELFCGSGNFTSELSAQGICQIFASDLDSSSIHRLSSRKLPGVTAKTMNLFQPQSWKELKKWGHEPLYLFLDPPRGGFPQIDKFCSQFSQLKNILYISCDLHAFIRDAKKLHQLGWTLEEIKPLDQFPHTPHIELISEFSKRSK